MKVFVFNLRKTGGHLFAALCIIVIIYFGFLGELNAVEVNAEAARPSYIALVIDGFGNDSEGTREFMYTDIPFTGAVLPGMPYTDEESRLLDSNGKDVILQMPASDSKGEKGQDELYISADTEAEKAEDITSAAVNDVNNCIGINTRMGPEIMGNSELVTAIAQVAKDEGLFMLSTLGTDKTKAKEVCEELDVKYFNGDIILDGSGDISAIEKNLKKAAETAIENGYIIAVGHVGTKGGKATAQAVKNVYENFKDRGIHFVTMSELIKLMDENTY